MRHYPKLGVRTINYEQLNEITPKEWRTQTHTPSWCDTTDTQYAILYGAAKLDQFKGNQMEIKAKPHLYWQRSRLRGMTGHAVIERTYFDGAHPHIKYK